MQKLLLIGFRIFVCIEAFANAAYPVGPLFGFASAALFLDLPEDLKGDSFLTAFGLVTTIIMNQ